MVILGLSPIHVHTINQERNESVTARELAPKVSPSSSLVAKREHLVGPQVITICVTVGEKGAPFIGGISGGSPTASLDVSSSCRAVLGPQQTCKGCPSASHLSGIHQQLETQR